MSTDNKVDYGLITQKLGVEGFILSKILINDMIASHQGGWVGAYCFDTHYSEVKDLMKKLIKHLVKYEQAIVEADHLVSLKNIDKTTYNSDLKAENKSNVLEQLPF